MIREEIDDYADREPVRQFASTAARDAAMTVSWLPVGVIDIDEFGLRPSLDEAHEWCKKMYAAGLIKGGERITAEDRRRIDAIWESQQP